MTVAIVARLSLRQNVTDIAERVAWSFAQPFVVVLTATGSAGLLMHQAWLKAAEVGGWAALISLITSVAAALGNWHPAGYLALVDRTARTFLATFVGVVVAGEFHSFADTGVGAALATAAVTAFLAAMKSLIGLAMPGTVGDTTAVPTHAGKAA